MPLPADAKERKAIPLFSGVIAYFPDALIEVAKVSKEGNDQHNPGQPLHWAKEKSTDHEDCIQRHTVDALKASDRAERIRHLRARAWRSLAALQIELASPARSSLPGPHRSSSAPTAGPIWKRWTIACSASVGSAPVSDKNPFRIVPVELLDLAFRALDDAETEIEAFEHDASWYTASQKMMDRIEQAKKRLKEYIK